MNKKDRERLDRWMNTAGDLMSIIRQEYEKGNISEKVFNEAEKKFNNSMETV